jgi:ADP-ribosylation factor-binding protein GGA
VDDEWDFTSALPVTAAPTSVLVTAPLRIEWTYERPPGQGDVIEIKSKISNGTAAPVSDVTLQVAASKVSPALPLKPTAS